MLRRRTSISSKRNEAPNNRTSCPPSAVNIAIAHIFQPWRLRTGIFPAVIAMKPAKLLRGYCELIAVIRNATNSSSMSRTAVRPSPSHLFYNRKYTHIIQIRYKRAVCHVLALVHPSTLHDLPPPCFTQKLVLDCEDLPQLGTLQRLPPPCAVQKVEPPTADLSQPTVEQRLPPP